MSKAILIMDMPECCDDCPFIYNSHNGKSYCIPPRIDKHIIEDVYDKPDWCPLKELPSKRGTIGGLVGVSVAPYEFRARGWNECIDEILGHDKT